MNKERLKITDKLLASVQPDWNGSDEHQACSLGGIRCVVSEALQPGPIGIGSVEYCRSLHHWPACDPYPDWLEWGRKIYRGTAPVKTRLFYKPADVPKRFVSGVMDNPPDGDWVASGVVEFVKEWRAYIVAGKVLGVFCYSDFNGEHISFPWDVPVTTTAAIDFGLTSDGRMLPVEVNDPYAIGWYGKLSQYKIYAEFLIAGWEWMNEHR
jgi:hypothetical protein